MADMMDLTRVGALMQAIFSSSTSFTITPGTSGGSPFVIAPPYKLRLMSAQGTNASNGTELASQYGYTAGGASMGASAFGAPSGGVQVNNNAVSWSVTGSWPTVPSLEIWDSDSTPKRWAQGALTSSIVGAGNGDTVQFAAGSISLSGAHW